MSLTIEQINALEADNERLKEAKQTWMDTAFNEQEARRVAQARVKPLKEALRTVCDDFEHHQERFSSAFYALLHAAQVSKVALAEGEADAPA